MKHRARWVRGRLVTPCLHLSSAIQAVAKIDTLVFDIATGAGGPMSLMDARRLTLCLLDALIHLQPKPRGKHDHTTPNTLDGRGGARRRIR